MAFLFRWISYDEADSLADNFGRGLRVLGHQPAAPICMFADTRFARTRRAPFFLLDLSSMYHVKPIAEGPESAFQVSICK